MAVFIRDVMILEIVCLYVYSMLVRSGRLPVDPAWPLRRRRVYETSRIPPAARPMWNDDDQDDVRMHES